MASHCFAEKGFRVFGVDISAVAVDWARSRFAASGLSGCFDQGDVS
ncbi:class I SAM-dependent methyltransferase [Pantoea ananatis]